MLGSHFDLSKEIAAIAERRERQFADDDKHLDRAYDNFDDRIRDFVRMITGGDQTSKTAIRFNSADD